MSDYISRQAAINAIFQYEYDSCCPINYKKIIKELPSVQPDETDIDNALALLDGIRSSGRMDYYSDYCALHDAISSIGMTSTQPEIIRCKDCKWFDTEWFRLMGERICNYLDNISVEDDCFCSWARRREDG